MTDTEFPTARVIWKARAIGQDINDPGGIPEEIPLDGIKVDLIPSPKVIECTNGAGDPVTYRIKEWHLVTANNGELINYEDPTNGIEIVASDAFPGESIVWTSIINDPTSTIPFIKKSWLAPASDIPIDLTSVAHVPNNPSPLEAYLQAVYDAREAAYRAHESADSAQTSLDQMRGISVTFDSTTDTPITEINQFILDNAGKVVVIRGEVVAWDSVVVPSNTTLDLRSAILYHKGAITLVNQSYANKTLDVYDKNIRIIGGEFKCLDTESVGSHLFFSRVNNLWIQDMNVTEWQADWCVTLKRCHKVHISGLNLDGVVGGVGADGLHLYASSDVVVSDAVIYSGDDAISMTVEDFPVPDADGTIENVTISNCVLSSSIAAGLKISCANATGLVRNIVVTNCTIKSTSGIGAVSISNATTTTTVDNIQISDCIIDNAYGFGAPVLQAYGVGNLMVTDCLMIAGNLTIPIRIDPSLNGGSSPRAKNALFSGIHIYANAGANCDVIADIHGIDNIKFDKIRIDGGDSSLFANGFSLGADYPVVRSEINECYFGPNCGGARVSWHSGALRVMNSVFDSDYQAWVINCAQPNTNALEIINNDLHKVPTINLDLATGPRVIRNNLGITDDNDLSAILNAILNGS